MSDWPELTVERDHETLAMLHLAAQMLGKIRVAHAPWVNHGWHVALQPNARGLATLPTAASGGRTFTLTLDLCRHAIVLWISDGGREELPLNAGSVSALHGRLIAMLELHDLPSTFNAVPNEIPDAVPFAADEAPRDYDRDSAERFRGAIAAMLPALSGSSSRPPSLIHSTIAWRQRSSVSVKVRSPLASVGMIPSPRALGWSAACHPWFIHGAWATRILPSICAAR